MIRPIGDGVERFGQPRGMLGPLDDLARGATSDAIGASELLSSWR